MVECHKKKDMRTKDIRINTTKLNSVKYMMYFKTFSIKERFLFFLDWFLIPFRIIFTGKAYVLKKKE